MPHNSNVVRANILRGFSHFVENRGVAVAPLLQDVGLCTSDLNDFERDLPFNSVAHLMESAAAACKDDSFGLALAKAYPVGGMGLFSFLVLNSTTIEDALRTVVRYVPLIKIPFRFTFEMQQRSACVAWQATEEVTSECQQIQAFGAALLMLRLRSLCPAGWQPNRVELAIPPQDAPEAQSIFGPNVVYNASRNAVWVDDATLHTQVPQTAPQLRAVLERYGEREMAGLLPRDNQIAEATRNVVLRLMGERRVSLEDVAAAMQCSPRTLQTRLAAGSKTYEEIVNEARMVRAVELMQRPDLSLTQIAYQLGFSELSAFTRAAQRWFGRTPSAQRQFLKLKLH